MRAPCKASAAVAFYVAGGTSAVAVALAGDDKLHPIVFANSVQRPGQIRVVVKAYNF